MLPRLYSISLRRCRALAASVTPTRRTPSMCERNSCVMRNSPERTRSRVISSQRASRAWTTWKRLQPAVCEICAISV